MFKLIIFGVVVYVIYLLFFKNKGITSTKGKSLKKDDSDTMVECSKCSTFVSAKEAIVKDGKFYCSKECAGVR